MNRENILKFTSTQIHFNDIILKIISQKKKESNSYVMKIYSKVIYVMKYKKIQYQSEIKAILSWKSNSVNFSTVTARSIILTLFFFLTFSILHFWGKFIAQANLTLLKRHSLYSLLLVNIHNYILIQKANNETWVSILAPTPVNCDLSHITFPRLFSPSSVTQGKIEVKPTFHSWHLRKR